MNTNIKRRKNPINEVNTKKKIELKLMKMSRKKEDPINEDSD